MNPTAILTGDWHIRLDVPPCRKDDYLLAQSRKIDFIIELSLKHRIPIFNSGDIFHKAYSHKFLETMLINKIKRTKFLFIPGNHDLVGHAHENFESSSVGVLNSAIQGEVSGVLLYEISGFKYSGETNFKNRLIAILHEYVHAPKNKKEHIEGFGVEQLFDKLPLHDLILTGDNHTTFTKRKGNQLLVNPGSLMRMTADQIDHKPCVFLWYAENNSVEQVFLPIEEDVFELEYLEKEKEREEREDAFIKRMNSNYELSLSFKGNMEQHLKVNKIKPAVEKIIWECIENG